MEAHYHLDSMIAIKQSALKLLDLQAGDSVIELGCGLGYDSELLATIVGNTGSVIAIDISKRMLNEAKKRSKNKSIIYSCGNANKLDFLDNTFSACRADRLLVSQRNINAVFSEAVRVIKPGGKLCITALDFGTITLWPVRQDINVQIVEYWQKMVRNPFIGRQLPALFRQHNLLEIKIEPRVFSINDYRTIQKIVQFEVMLSDMVAQQLITEQQKINTINILNEADEAGEFFWSINLISVVGVKP